MTSFQDLINTLADHGDFDTSIGSFAWRAVESYLNQNGMTCENDEEQRDLVEDAVFKAKSELPCFHVLTFAK